MPKTVGYSRDNIQDTIGVIDKFITWLDQPLLTTSNVLFNALNTTEDVVIGGNLTVNGVSTIISTEIVEIQDNILLINSEETGNGVTANLSGIEVDRGTLANYQFVFQESTQLFKIGELGQLQTVATREDTPLNGGIMVYNSLLGRLDSVTDITLPITFSSSVNSISSTTGSVIISGGGGLGITGDVYTDGRISIKGNDYSNFIDSNISNDLIVNSGTNFIFQQQSGTEIQIPTDVLLTFNNSSYITSDATELHITNTIGNIYLTPKNNGSIILPINSYLEWDTSNRIIYNNTDLVLDSSGYFTINAIINSTKTDSSTSTTVGSLLLAGGMSISNTSDATSSSSGGTFTTGGGASITKSLFVGNKVNVGDTNLSTTQVTGQGINFRSLDRIITTSSTNDLTINSFEGSTINLSSGVITNASTVYITDTPHVSGGGSILNSYSLFIGSGISRFDGTVIITDTTTSTSSTTGSLLLNGGISTSNTTDSISSSNGGTFTTEGGMSIKKRLMIGNTIDIGDVSITTNHIATQGINFRSRNRQLITNSSTDAMFNTFEGGDINTTNTINTASTLYINTYPSVSGGGNIINSYSLYVNSGNVKINDSLIVSGTTATTSSSTGSLLLDGGLGISNITDANSSTNGGSITTAGGMAVGKKLYVGSQVNTTQYILNNTNLNRFSLELINTELGSNTGSDFTISRYNDLGILIEESIIINRDTGNITINSITPSTSTSIGSFTLAGGISISNDTNATNLVNGGSFTTAGGMSIGKDVYIGGTASIVNLDIDGITLLDQVQIDTTDGTFDVSGSNAFNFIVNNTSIIKSLLGTLNIEATIGSVSIIGNSGINMNSNSGISINANGMSNFTSTTDSLTISGIGLNLYGNTDPINIINTNSIDITSGTGGINIDTTDTIVGIKIGTGAISLPITIGHPISEVLIADNLTIGGNLNVLGVTTSINTSVISIVDNTFVVNSAPSGTADGGYMIRRYQTPNDIASGDLLTDTPFLTSTFQSGSSVNNTLVLNSSSSSVNDFYVGWWIRITSGSGINQVRRIKNYDGTTKTAIIYNTADNTGSFFDGLDLSVAPLSGDTYALHERSYGCIYYHETSDEIRMSYVPYDIPSGQFSNVVTFLPLRVNNLITLDGIVNTGDIVSNGKLLIDVTDTESLLIRKSGDTGDIFTVDSTGNIIIANPINTVSSNINLIFKQNNSVNSPVTYSQISSTIVSNTAGNLKNDLIFSVQKGISGLSTLFTLKGDTNAYADFSTNVNAVRVLNTTTSTSTTTGSLLLDGGMSISNTTEATSTSSGGTFTTGGGMAIAKKMYIGGQTTITSTSQVVDTNITYSGIEGSLNIQGDIVLYNPTKNTILYRSVGVNGPTFTNRSSGTKLVLYPSITGTKTDFAIGIESFSMWYSVPNTLYSYKFYIGTTETFKVSNSGINITGSGTGIVFSNGSNTSGIVESSNILYIKPFTNTVSEGFEFRDITGTNSRIRINSDGKLSLGISGYSGTPSNSGSFLNINSVTFTDSTTLTSNTVSNMTFNSIGQPTLSAINSSVTTTTVCNVKIIGAPIKGTNETITNAHTLFIGQGTDISSSGSTVTNASTLYIEGSPIGTNLTNSYSLFIDSGISRLDGQLNITDNTQVSTTANIVTGTEGSLNIQGDLTLYNGTKNTIIFNRFGINAPSLLNRSIGTKLVLYPQTDSTNIDYAIGIETNAMWYSVQSTNASHKFYLGINNRFQIDNTGILLNSGSSSVATIIRLNTSDSADNKGIIIKGGGGNTGDHIRGAQIELYGNEFNTGNAILSTGELGELKLRTGNSIDRLNILTTGQINISSNEDATTSNSGAIRLTSGGMSIAKSLIIGTTSGSILALDFNQRYDLSGNILGHLNLQSKTSSVSHIFRHFTLNGNNADDNLIQLFGLGTPTNNTNSEFIKLGYTQSTSNYTLSTGSTGTGTSRTLNIETGMNTSQLQLMNTGQVSLSSTEASTSSTTGALRLIGGLAIDNTTNATDNTNGGSFTTTGGASIGKDVFIGGDLTVTGSICSGIITTPTITTSNTQNITGTVSVFTNVSINNTNQRTLSANFRCTPTTSQIITAFEFTLPSAVTNYINIFDITVMSNGYRNDANPINLENVIGYAVVGTTRCKISFTSGGTDLHTLQVIVRYTAV